MLKKQEKLPVACPRCGHVQLEPRGLYSTICKQCQQHIRLEKEPGLAPIPPAAAAVAQRPIVCFSCRAELMVATAAESTMCKRCSHHIDLRDHVITHAVSKNFATKGRLVIQESGNLFNSDSIAREVVIKGKFLGKIAAEERLVVHSSALIKGIITGETLVIPASEHFRWADILRFNAAEIAGELAARLHTHGTTLLKPTARFFGDLQAGHLVVESGAVFVGSAWVGANAGRG